MPEDSNLIPSPYTATNVSPSAGPNVIVLANATLYIVDTLLLTGVSYLSRKEQTNLFGAPGMNFTLQEHILLISGSIRISTGPRVYRYAF